MVTGAWADNLIVTPLTEKVNPCEKSSKCQPKVTANRPNKLPIRRSRPSKAAHHTKGLHDFDVHSPCQPQIGEVDVFDSDVEENLGQVSDEESDHDDSEDSDFREWQSDGSEEFDILSLDEDDELQDENESLDDVDLENDTQLRMTIGHETMSHWNIGHRGKPTYTIIIHPIPDSCFWGESELPALDPPFELRKRGRPEKHKRRESRLPIPPQLSTIQLSGTKRCKKCKQLGHNSLTCGQPRDKYGRLQYRKKPRQKTGNPVGRPRKIQRLSQASKSTVATSGVPTQFSQAL
ncbi:hypothetical protein Cgig2_016777 [Carnegiea gigantea]|uniref:Uncharacterized protein n=1 Tax=Carnegiea gigantea TaxID=171969 RepID=A0A9Q1Q6Y4_9CARY|nr:hypothetical protein Cgig2_016777 [Carnegiea gigantea]